MPDHCIVEAGLNCKDFSVSSGTAFFTFENGMGKSITINSVEVKNDALGFTCTSKSELVLNNGQSGTITALCSSFGSPNEAKQYKSQLLINWSNQGSPVYHVSEGELFTKISS